MIEGGGVSRRIDLSLVQRFTKQANTVIRNNGFKATVGSASLKWTCNSGHGCAGNWWGNTNIDFYTVHYYAWMATGGNTYDPFNSKPSDWGLPAGAKVLIGETPSTPDQSLRG